MMKNFRILSLVAALMPLALSAQTVSFGDFIRAVGKYNASAVAERYNLDIASANLRASRVFNDPELAVTYGNNQDWDLMMGQNVDVELGYNFSLGGVRRARMNVSMSEKEMTDASVDAFMCNLRAEASIAWSEAWKLKKRAELAALESELMEKVADSDSIRLSLGDISWSDAMQSALEARTLRGEVLSLMTEYRNSLLGLSLLAGGMELEDIEDELNGEGEADRSLEELYEIALAERADLKVAELSHQLSDRNLNLIKASRAMELGVTLGYSFNKEVRNEIAPAPQFHGFTVGVSIPLKFSSFNKGEVNAAKASVDQRKVYLDAAVSQVKMEVGQAYNSFVAAGKILSEYSEDIIKSASEILESRRIGYSNGDSSFTEFLSAQYTFDDVMSSYIDAECEYFRSTVLLNQSVGRY